MPGRKHVLISAVGLTPQVITETLYYFWCRASSMVPIAEVFAITTLLGKQGLDAAFLRPNPNFFYPPPNATAIPLADGSTFPSEQIRIELAFVPLLMLREKIPFLVERSEMSYSELIRAAQIEVDGLQIVLPLRINRTSRSLHIGDVSVPLTALQFALYMIFAQRRMGCEDKCPGCAKCGFYLSQIGDGELRPLLKSQLREMGFTDPRYGDLESWGSSDPSGETPKTRFFETLSRINQRIRRKLGSASWTHDYCIKRQTPRSEEGLYCIPIAPGRIEIE